MKTRKPLVLEVGGCIECFFRNDTYCTVSKVEGTGSIPLRYFEQDAAVEVPIWCPLGERPHQIRLKEDTAKEEPPPTPDPFTARMRARRQQG